MNAHTARVIDAPRIFRIDHSIRSARVWGTESDERVYLANGGRLHPPPL